MASIVAPVSPSASKAEALAIMLGMEGGNLGEDDIRVGGFNITITRKEKYVYETTMVSLWKYIGKGGEVLLEQ